LSWSETKEYCNLLGLNYVPVLYEGLYNNIDWDKLYSVSRFGGEQEGYVMRLSSKFNFTHHGNSIVKWVRKGHVTTNHNWMYSSYEKNEME